MKVEFNPAELELMQKAHDKWGLQAQVGLAVDECAELIVALQKHTNRMQSEQSLDNVLDEIADVEIMCAQMRYAFDISDEALRKRMAEKLARLATRLK